MKKLIVFITISLIIAASFTVLSANATPEKSDENLQIGISKLISHPALDAIEEGIKDYLNENGVVAAYETQTANGEISTASSIAQLFKTKGKDLVVGIATPTAQALANVFTDIPVVFATVTDPEAAGLMGIENVAGTSDMVPVKEQLNLNYGLEVTGVHEGKMKEAGIRRGFIILKVNDMPMRSVEDMETALKEASRSSEPVLFITGKFPSGRVGYYAVNVGQEE